MLFIIVLWLSTALTSTQFGGWEQDHLHSQSCHCVRSPMALWLPAGSTEQALYALNLTGARVDFCNSFHNRIAGTLLIICVRHIQHLWQPKSLPMYIFGFKPVKTIVFNWIIKSCFVAYRFSDLGNFSILLLSYFGNYIFH